MTEETRPRILLIEDFEPVARVTALALERNGFSVVLAASLAEADQHLQNPEPFDVVIADARLGDGLGIEWAKRRVPLPWKLVLVSGGSMEDEIAAFPEPAKIRFMQKPFSGLDLAKCVRALMRPGTASEGGS